MKRFKTHKLLSESFLTRPLGLSSPQNMGLVSNHPGVAEDIHMKMPAPQDDEDMDDDMLMKKSDDEEDEDDGEEHDLKMHDDDDLDAAEEDDDDMDDADDEEGDDDGMPMGKPHNNSAFMGESKKGDMKIEDDDVEEDEEEEREKGDDKMDKEDDEMCGCKGMKKGMKKMKSGDKKCSSSMMKKMKSGDKKCSSSMMKKMKSDDMMNKMKSGDKKCSSSMMKKMKSGKKMKKPMKESIAPKNKFASLADYLPPTSNLLNNKDFMSRVAEGYAESPTKKKFSGLTEEDRVKDGDNSFKEPGPGEVGYAPATRIGTQQQLQNLNETLQDMTRRLRRLEKIVSRIS